MNAKEVESESESESGGGVGRKEAQKTILMHAVLPSLRLYLL
jgi:hypothetical protein